MRNTEILLGIAKDLRELNLPVFDEEQSGFNMGGYWARSSDGTLDKTGKGCKTVGCIAGWIVFKHYKGYDSAEAPEDSIFTTAQNIAGLSYNQARKLFIPSVDFINEVTPIQAAQAIENLVYKGNPNWNEVMGIVEKNNE